MAGERILILDEDEASREKGIAALRKAGFSPETAETSKAALEKMEGGGLSVFLCDPKTRASEGFDFLRRIKAKRSDVIVVVATSTERSEIALEYVRCGAADILFKPIKGEELAWFVRKAIEREKARKEAVTSKTEAPPENEFANIVAKSNLMKEIFNTIQKIAEYKTTCLLLGESGTGKELVARAIHYNSSRAEQPFITVNCGAIPENLLESELFGHVKGSFTGAVRTKKGLFEEAHNGSLFLDEIGELPLLLQVKLLRALQEEEIRRVGDVTPIKIDVRIIAATTKDLTKEVEKGNFREDLFYRLHVLPINLPPLRDRKEDIPILCAHFISKYNKKLGSSVKGLDPKVLKLFMDHDWPGNVRELENSIERAMVLCATDRILPENLPMELRNAGRSSTTGMKLGAEELSIKKTNRVIEEDLIVKALQRAQGNRTKAAKLLEISHRALLYKIKRYKLDTQIREIGKGAGR